MDAIPVKALGRPSYQYVEGPCRCSKKTHALLRSNLCAACQRNPGPQWPSHASWTRWTFYKWFATSVFGSRKGAGAVCPKKDEGRRRASYVPKGLNLGGR